MLQVKFNYMPPKSSTTSPPTPPAQSPQPDSSPTLAPEEQATPEIITDEELVSLTSELLSSKTMSKIHNDSSNLPPVPPAYTPGPAECRTEFDSFKLHKLFGCQRFRNQQHIIASSVNAKILKSGELLPTLGDLPL
jgi:hypothetical protein